MTDVAGNTKVSGTLSVYTHDEEGLQGVAVDPNFATNRWIYLYYSPTLPPRPGTPDQPARGPTGTGGRGTWRLFRFTLNSRRHAQPGQREDRAARSPTTVGSAATSVVT